MAIRNSIIIFVALLVGGLLNFGAISVFSRLLNPAEYGTFALAMASSALAIAFLYQWAMHSFMRFLPQKDQEGNKLYLANFTAILALISVAFISLSLAAYEISRMLGIGPMSLSVWIWILVPAAAILETFFTVASHYTRLVRERIRLFAIATILRSAIYIAAGFYLVQAGLSFYGLLIAVVLSFLIPCLFLIATDKDWRRLSFTEVRGAVVREIMIFGFPIIAVTSIQTAIASADNFMLTLLIGPEATGQFAVALDLVTKSLIFLMIVINRTTYPLVVKKLEHEGMEAAQIQYKHNTTLLMMLSVPACAGLAILSENIADILLGHEFRDTAGRIIPFLTLVSFLNCAFQFYLTPAFHLAKKTHLMIAPVVLAFFVNIIVSYNAIPVFGINGAIIGSFCAYLTCFALSLYSVRKAFAVPFPAFDFAKVLIATFIMSASIWCFRGLDSIVLLVAGIVLGGIVYTVAIAVLNVGGYTSLVKDKLKARLQKN